ncbi:hypothetical protein BC941DRAFT_447357 [Chlamydoabsidia padenii]|nr:hypothetical protein BC941DRAFT_447357 [Chlamydoabsidia padenii]
MPSSAEPEKTQISSQDNNDGITTLTPRWLIEEEPDTIWTRFIVKYRFGKAILVTGGITGVLVIMFIVLGILGVFKNAEYRGMAGIPSVGSSKYDGDSWGTATEGHFAMGGKGDGTYYDPGVGITSCGGSFTAQDSIVALNHVDYGRYADPNESPACGACIMVTGPLGTTKATIQDMCPGCGRGSLDLSPQVFSAVGNFVDGRIPVSWTSC